MRKTVFVFGSIAGVVVLPLMLLNVFLYSRGSIGMDTAEITGYGSMIVALSMIFFGIKSFRDSHQNGVIRFGKAFLLGLFITLVASAFYVGGWEVYYQSNDELRATFMATYAAF